MLGIERTKKPLQHLIKLLAVESVFHLQEAGLLCLHALPYRLPKLVHFQVSAGIVENMREGIHGAQGIAEGIGLGTERLPKLALQLPEDIVPGVLQAGHVLERVLLCTKRHVFLHLF